MSAGNTGCGASNAGARAGRGDTGLIFDIQRFCVHDGPGIRTTVFFKGCNLRCHWCHNPESYSPRSEISYYSDRCIGCGKCLNACPRGCHTAGAVADMVADDVGVDVAANADAVADVDAVDIPPPGVFGAAGASSAVPGGHVFDRGRCVGCGACAGVCNAGALVATGKPYTVAEVMERVKPDAPFYKNSGGGLTCSGGEPLLQSGFVARLMRAAREAGIHTALDTAGNVRFDVFSQVLPYTCLVLFDLKCMDGELHRRVTGAGNGLILENLRRLSGSGADIWIRIPVIPGVNDREANMLAAAELLSGLSGIKRLDLLPYHSLGAGKYESLGITPCAAATSGGGLPRTPDAETMLRLAGAFAGAEYEVIVN